jgi:hypothetical protein
MGSCEGRYWNGQIAPAQVSRVGFRSLVPVSPQLGNSRRDSCLLWLGGLASFSWRNHPALHLAMQRFMLQHTFAPVTVTMHQAEKSIPVFSRWQQSIFERTSNLSTDLRVHRCSLAAGAR